MNELIQTIAQDLSIDSYHGEPLSDYVYRLCYSALASHMLVSASGRGNGTDGISKKAQTELLQRLIDLFQKNTGVDKQRFIGDTDDCISLFRRIYEEIGYLLIGDTNNSVIARYGRTVKTDGGYLYFGIPAEISKMVGLGVFADAPGDDAGIFETIMRDTRSPQDFIDDIYNPIDFEERDFNKSDLLFFDSLSDKPPSASWVKTLTSINTLAKSITTRTIYRVICIDNKGTLLFADNPFDSDKGKLTSYELRRIYIALKAYYRHSAVAWINPLDDTYFEVTLSLYLPNREYYSLLLLSWPKQNAFDRKSFITTSELLPTIETILKNIGIKIIRRQKYV